MTLTPWTTNSSGNSEQTNEWNDGNAMRVALQQALFSFMCECIYILYYNYSVQNEVGKPLG
jgi:hypothetical protein